MRFGLGGLGLSRSGLGIGPIVGLGGGGAGMPYDSIPNITAAYGMRRLRSAYTGNLLRLRRSSDSSEQDFGYTSSGDLDTAAIATFIGAGSGYIVTWYDQSGNGRNATQATAAAQPLYVASGQNSHPVLRTDGVDDTMAATGLSVDFENFSYQWISRRIVDNGQNSVIGFNAFWGTGYEYREKSGSLLPQSSVESAQSILARAVNLVNAVSDNDVLRQRGNGVAVADSSTPNADATLTSVTIGGRGGAYAFGGDYMELVIANAAWSTAQRQAAETAANEYWGVY